MTASRDNRAYLLGAVGSLIALGAIAGFLYAGSAGSSLATGGHGTTYGNDKSRGTKLNQPGKHGLTAVAGNEVHGYIKTDIGAVEIYLPDMQVRLINNVTQQTSTTTTDATGQYVFPAQDQGTYSLCVDGAPGYFG